MLQPGERVVIASGTYREWVRPERGGTGADKMISYEAAPGAKVYVKGSDILKDGWTLDPVLPVRHAGAPGSTPAASPAPTWGYRFTGAMFPDAYNPFALASVAGDRAWLDTRSVDMGPYFRRRALVFVDGKPLEPVELQRELETPIAKAILRAEFNDGDTIFVDVENERLALKRLPVELLTVQ